MYLHTLFDFDPVTNPRLLCVRAGRSLVFVCPPPKQQHLWGGGGVGGAGGDVPRPAGSAATCASSSNNGGRSWPQHRGNSFRFHPGARVGASLSQKVLGWPRGVPGSAVRDLRFPCPQHPLAEQCGG